MAVAVASAGNIKIRVHKSIREILSARLKSLDVNRAINDAVKEHNNEISDLNTEQLNKGQKADGGTTGDYASISYKGRLRPVDLYDTGAFHKSIKANPFGKAFEMKATDEKTEMLQDRYGDDILGLTDENITEAGEIIKETMINNVRRQL